MYLSEHMFRLLRAIATQRYSADLSEVDNRTLIAVLRRHYIHVNVHGGLSLTRSGIVMYRTYMENGAPMRLHPGPLSKTLRTMIPRQRARLKEREAAA